MPIPLRPARHGATAIALSALVVARSALASGEIPPAIVDFLDSGAICSAADVDDVVREADVLELTISIGAATAAGLSALDPDGRADWLALHCPPSPVLDGLGPHVSDLRVETRIDGGRAMPDGVLSCRAYASRADERRQAIGESVLERLARRLEDTLRR